MKLFMKKYYLKDNSVIDIKSIIGRNRVSQLLIFTVCAIIFYILIYDKLREGNQASLQFMRHTVHCSRLRLHLFTVTKWSRGI